MKKITFLLSFITIIFFTQQSYSQCTDTNTGTGNNITSSSMGQSFEAACSGTLGSIGVFVHTVTTGHTLTVYSGDGTGGTNLGSVTFDFSTVSANITTDYKSIDISSEGISLTSGNTYTFVISGGAGQRLYYNNGDNSTGQLYFNGGAQPTLDLMYNVTVTGAADTAPPVVQSITHTSVESSNSTSQEHTVTFDEAASAVTANDFELTATGTATGTIGTPTTSDGGLTYSVDVTSISGTGTLRLDLKASTDIIDGSSNGNGTNGNVAAFATGSVKTVDTEGPGIATVTSSTGNGSYGVGQLIQVWIIFHENVVVTGTPQLTLETGTTDRVADYTPGGGANVMYFNYTVQAGDISSDLDYVATTSLTLNGGTIQDAAGNDSPRTLPTPGATGSLSRSKTFVIDGVSPTVTSVSSSTADGSYNEGDVVTVTVNFDENVTVTGTPQLTLETGTTDRTINYNGTGSGTTTLEFTYTVQAGDTSADLDYVATNSLTAGTSIQDALGNDAALTLPSPGAANSLGANKALVIDTTSPTVTSVSSSTANGSYKAGDAVVVTVTFDETVTVTGTPQLTLETGTTDRTINYNGTGSGTTTLEFTYTVQAGDTSADLDYVATNSLTAGTSIQDTAGNDATLTLATPGAANSLGANKALVIDTTSPTVTSVSSSTANGTYKAGDAVVVTVTFDEAVTVTGTPQLTLETGTTDRTINYNGTGSGTTTLEFTYTVQAGDTSADLDYVATNSLTAGTSIQDAVGNDATLTLATPGAANSLGANKALVIDTTSPTVTSVSSSTANGTYKAGDAIVVTVTFDEAVTVTGTPQLTLETGTIDRTINYNGTGSGTTTLEFTYTVQAGDTSADLDYVATNSLTAGTSIQDAVGNDATLTLATPGAANSLGANKALVIDTTSPTVTSVSSSTANGSYKAGDAVVVTVTFDEVVTVTGTPQLTLETGTTDRTINYNGTGSGTTTLEFTYTVQAGDTSADLDYVATNSLTTGTSIQDAVGNDATLTLATPGAANSLGANKALVIDTTGPVVTSVSVPTDATYGLGQNLDFTVNFDEAVTVTGTPQIDITIGATLVQATYVSGSGTAALLFRYEILVGQEDTDGVAVGTLSANGGTMQDALANDATLTLNSVDSTTGVLVNAKNPSVTTTAASLIEQSLATMAGDVTAEGGSTVIERGVVYALTATNSNPEISGTGVTQVTIGSGTGTFSQSITGLAVNSGYSFKAYATNSQGTSYGSVETFTTLAIPTVAFTSTTSSGAESVASANLSVDLSGSNSLTTTVDYTVSGTASGSGTDYTLADGTLTFNPGSTNEDITIASIVDDAILEANETVIVTLSSPSNATLGTNTIHTYTITNNDTAAVIIADISGNEDSGAITVTATLDNAVQGGFTVDVSTADGTATIADSDYTSVTSETLTFAGTAGETQTFTITPTVDTKLEANETVTVSQSNLSATTLGVVITDGATVTIDNDDAAAVTIADISGNEDSGAITVTATLDNAVQGGFTLDVSTVDGTATTADSDYTSVTSETLTFAGTAGETQTFTITPTVDTKLEANETVTVSQSNLSATTLGVVITDGATVTIDNDDAAAVTIADISGNEDSGAITVTATLDSAVQGGFTLDVSTADGTATIADSDYTSVTSETLTFAGTAGETQTFTITPTVDTKLEANETVTVSQSNLSATTLGVVITDGATVTIDNDDAATITLADISVGEGDGTINVIATLDNAVQGGFTLNASTVDGTATIADNDYVAVTNQAAVFTGTAGEMQSFTVTITDDAIGEDLETLTLIQSSLSGTTLTSGITITDTATITINDDDAPVLTAMTPLDEAVDVVLSTDLTITYNQDVVKGTGNILLKNKRDDSIIQSIDVIGSEVSIVNNVVTINPSSDLPSETQIYVEVPAGAFENSSNQGNDAITGNDAWNFTTEDITSPTVTLSTATSSPTNMPFTVTVQFSEQVTNFDLTDIVVTNGAASVFNQTNTLTYTVLITPALDGEVTVSVLAGTLQDASSNSNNNIASNVLNLTYDSTRPEITITTDVTDPTNTGFTATFTITEELADFEVADVILVNASIDNFDMQTSTLYTATITPIGDGIVSVTIPEDTLEDNSNNGNLAASYSITYDATRPFVASIASSVSSPTNGPFVLTYTFTEPVTGFTLSDYFVTNGTASDFMTISPTQYSALITPTITVDANVTVDIFEAAAFDLASNPSFSGGQFSIAYDQSRPEIVITSDVSDPTNTDFIATFTFSEDVTGFDMSDIIIDNASLANFVPVSGSVYTVEVTPDSDGEVTIDIDENISEDIATNGNLEAQYSIEYDVTRPTVEISSSANDPTNAGFTVTINFDEPVSGFEMTDITIVNGTPSAFTTITGSEYTIFITPDVDGAVSLEILENLSIDAATNGNEASDLFEIQFDGTNPTVVISGDAPNPTNTTFTATFTFSEDVTGFDVTDITVGNGSAGAVSGTGSVYTTTITPTADGIVTVDVAANLAIDLATNGNEAATQYSVLYDATNPTITMSTTSSVPVNGPFTLDIEFSEDVTGFDITDIVVTDGTPSSFVADPTDPKLYSVLITPLGAVDVIIDIAAGSAQDAATNGNDAAQVMIAYDNIPPTPPLLTHVSDYTCSGNTNMTGDTTLEISGAAEEGSIVEVYQDGVSIGTVQTGANGFFTFDHTGTTLADGTYSFTVTATDNANNTSSMSAPLTIIINSVDTDGDGLPDFCDDDVDGNGTVDADEDCDGDGIVDHLDTDNSSCGNTITQTKQYGFSPNGDGVNDGWFIDGITAYPNSVVQVFNRSGKLVFKKKGYQNDWNGVSNQIANNGTGTRLPVGPYLFIIDLGDGSTPTRGWIYINY
ncbi:MAG: gliding motility-associated C-terminal domain-containing protein [Flavobacteriaceae bacterium]